MSLTTMIFLPHMSLPSCTLTVAAAILAFAVALIVLTSFVRWSRHRVTLKQLVQRGIDPITAEQPWLQRGMNPNTVALECLHQAGLQLEFSMLCEPDLHYKNPSRYNVWLQLAPASWDEVKEVAARRLADRYNIKAVLALSLIHI